MDNSPRLFPKLQTFYLQHLGQEKKEKKRILLTILYAIMD